MLHHCNYVLNNEMISIIFYQLLFVFLNVQQIRSANETVLINGLQNRSSGNTVAILGGNEIRAISQFGHLRCVIDLMIYWKRHAAVFFIESHTGWQPKAVSRYVDDLLLGRSEVVFLDENSLSTENLLTLVNKHGNVVTVCGPNLTSDILTKINSLQLFQLNYTWILAGSSDPEFPPDANISAKAQVTTIVGVKTDLSVNDVFVSFNFHRVKKAQFASWSIITGLLFFEDPIMPEKLQGRIFRSIGILHLPYLNMTIVNGRPQFSGFLFDLARAIVDDLNAKLPVISTMEQNLGHGLSGTFTGLLGAFNRREGDLSINTMAMTVDRGMGVRFIMPLNDFHVSIIYEAPLPTIPPTAHWLPFPASVWLVLFAMLLLSIICIAVIAIFSSQLLWTSVETLPHSTTFTLLSWTFFVEVLQDPSGGPSKITYATLLVATLITFNSYSAGLISNLSNQKMEVPIKTMEDLARSKDYLPLMSDNTVHASFLKHSIRSDYSAVWRKAVAHSSLSLVATHLDVVRQMFTGKFAVITDEISFRALLKDQCSVLVYNQPTVNTKQSLFSRFDFPYSRMIHGRMIRLYEGGVIQRLRQKYKIGSKWICSRDLVNLPFGLRQVLLPFYVLVGGMIISLLTLVVENIMQFYLMLPKNY